MSSQRNVVHDEDASAYFVQTMRAWAEEVCNKLGDLAVYLKQTQNNLCQFGRLFVKRDNARISHAILFISSFIDFDFCVDFAASTMRSPFVMCLILFWSVSREACIFTLCY